MRDKNGRYIKGCISSFKGKTHNESARSKMSLSRQGKKFTKEHKEHIKSACQGINAGIIRSKETRLKISLAKTKLPGSKQEKRRIIAQRYEARKVGAIGSHTLQEWEYLKLFYNFMCLCCKRYEPEIVLSEDHIIPLSKGGSNYITNIQPLCTSCNSRKHTTTISYLPSNHNDLIYTEKGKVN